jgi:hypothetical protein
MFRCLTAVTASQKKWLHEIFYSEAVLVAVDSLVGKLKHTFCSKVVTAQQMEEPF